MNPEDDRNPHQRAVFDNENGGAIAWLIIAVLCILAVAAGSAVIALWEFFT